MKSSKTVRSTMFEGYVQICGQQDVYNIQYVQQKLSSELPLFVLACSRLLCGLLPDIQRSPVAACSSPLLKTAQKVDTSVALQRLYTKVTCIVWTSTSTHPLSAKAVAIEREIWLISIFTIQSNTNVYLNFLLYKICNLPPHHIFSQDCEHWFDLI